MYYCCDLTDWLSSNIFFNLLVEIVGDFGLKVMPVSALNRVGCLK